MPAEALGWLVSLSAGCELGFSWRWPGLFTRGAVFAELHRRRRSSCSGLSMCELSNIDFRE